MSKVKYLVSVFILFAFNCLAQSDSAKYVAYSQNYPALMVHRLYQRFAAIDSTRQHLAEQNDVEMEYDSLKVYFSIYIDKRFKRMPPDKYDYFLYYLNENNCNTLVKVDDNRTLIKDIRTYAGLMKYYRKEYTYEGFHRGSKPSTDFNNLTPKGGGKAGAAAMIIAMYEIIAVICSGNN